MSVIPPKKKRCDECSMRAKYYLSNGIHDLKLCQSCADRLGMVHASTVNS